MKKEILVIGAGEHAYSSIEIILQNSEYHIIGLVGTKNEK